jgi:hypothetical protein
VFRASEISNRSCISVRRAILGAGVCPGPEKSLPDAAMTSNELPYLIKNKIEIETKETVTRNSSKMIRWANMWNRTFKIFGH